jgi:hypothetical protein
MTTVLNKVLLTATISAFIGACTQNAPEVIDVPSRAGQQNPSGEQNTQVVDASMPIQAAMLTTYQVNISEAKYKFTYLDYTKEDALKFENGVAKLTLNGLPAGKQGSISLEVSDNSGVKLRGGANNVTLVAGRVNNLDIKLEPTSGGNPIVVPMTTDLVINVQIDQGTAPQPSPNVVAPNNNVVTPNVVTPNNNVVTPNVVTPNNNVVTPNVVTPNNNVVTPNVVTPNNNVVTPNVVTPNNNVVTPNVVDPNIATWDGRSDRGNSRWLIVPIN